MIRRRVAVAALLLAGLVPTVCPAELTPDQTAKVRTLIAQFSNRRFAARQEAVGKLITMGTDVLPMVRKTLAGTKDNEVKLRCGMVIKALAPGPDGPALVENRITPIGRTTMGWNIYYNRSWDGTALSYRFNRGRNYHVRHNRWTSPAYKFASETVLSPDGRRVMYWIRDNAGTHVVCDRKPSDAVDEVSDMVFSPDSRRAAWSCERDGGAIVVCDGTTSKRYDAVTLSGFSPDARHLGWIAERGERRFVVVDGHEGPSHERICRLRLVNRTARRLYASVRFFVFDGGRARMVRYEVPAAASGPLVEKEERAAGTFPKEAARGGTVHCSPGGRFLILLHETDDGTRVFCNGRDVGKWESIKSVSYPPDGAHYAMRIGHENKTMVVRDGEVGPGYDGIGTIYQPRSGRMLYVGVRGNERYMVIDNRERPETYDRAQSFTTSDDGRHVAWCAMRERRWNVYVDGREIGAYGRVRYMIFSPDGERLACVANDNGRMFVVCDGRAGPRFTGVNFARFSLDGKHLVYAAGDPGVGSFVICDGVRGRAWDGIATIPQGGVSSKGFRYVVLSNNRESLVEMTWPKDLDWTHGLEPMEPGD